MSSISLALPPRFSFPETVQSHGWYRLAPFRWDDESETLWRTEKLGEVSVDLRIRIRRGRLELHSEGGDLKPWTGELGARARRMFQLDLDLTEFHDLCRRSPAHASVAADAFGRLLCGATLFEDAVKIITTTNTMWRQTVRMVELLSERCGTRSTSGRAAFPSPSEIAAVPESRLKEECRLGYRAKSIHALAAGIEKGNIDLRWVSDQTLPTPELFERYKTLPGIGPYGAAHLLAMDGRHDFIAVDTEFRRFVRQRYHGGRKVADKSMVRRYSKWGRWKYLAYWSELWNEDALKLGQEAGEDK